MSQKKLPFERKRSFSVGLSQTQIDFLQDLVDAGLYPSISDCVSTVVNVFIESVENGNKHREQTITKVMDAMQHQLNQYMMVEDYQRDVNQHKDEIMPSISTNKGLVDADVLQLPPTVVSTEDEEAVLLKGIIEIATKRRLKPQSIVDEWAEGRQEDFDRVFKGNKAYLLRKLEAEQNKNQETFVVPQRPSLENERKEAKERHINEIVMELPGKIHAYVKAEDGDKKHILQDELLPEVERMHRYLDKPERDPFTNILIERLQPIINERYLTDPEFEYQDALDAIELCAKRVTPKTVSMTVMSATSRT